MKTKNYFLTLLLAAMMCVPFTASAQVTIGSTELPEAMLDIRAYPEMDERGQGFRLVDGNQASGRVLTAVCNDGFGTWQTPAAGWLLNGNIISDADAANGLNRIGTTTSQPVRFITSNQERMRINTIGNVGIGTDSPVHRFHISGSGHAASSITMEQSDVDAAPLGYPVLRVVNRSTNAQILGDISFGRTNTMLTAQSNAYIRAMTADDDESGILYFGTRSGGVNAARLLISSEGNVGIGTIAPHSRLHVAGGGVAMPIIITSAGSFTVTDAHHTIAVSTPTSTINLPSPVGISGRIYVISLIGGPTAPITSGTVTIATPANNIRSSRGAAPTLVLNRVYFGGVTVQSDGTNWIVINVSPAL